ncbi:hypothetical protein D0Z00_000821 [Geotrichum galactomycetum]|uniref:Uncharacterized protein n=1 Tax=Geotrichum galactomycetum TaxID=27317 RepID=A0ACB6V8V6_9ASCO|nr:hypothetical protein D0Z00_000821 [Geotrichum candidum]
MPALTHINAAGSAHMVNIADKPVSNRSATAAGRIEFSCASTLAHLHAANNKKGDVLGVARVAGIMAVKRTADLIPLCHPGLRLTRIECELAVVGNGSTPADDGSSSSGAVEVRTTVDCEGRTGVEMEALVGAMASLATVYDMCKAVDKGMVIGEVRVVRKVGGRHDYGEETAKES